MRRFLLFVFLVSACSIQAQNKYRFAVGGGFHSLMFWGFRSFENVVVPTGPNSDYYTIYQKETYNLNYKNYSKAINYSYGFSVNWLNREKFMLGQRFSFFKGNLTDGIILELVDIGDGFSLDDYYDASNVNVGSTATIIYKTEIVGLSTALVLYKRMKNQNLQLGAGVYCTAFSSRDSWWTGVNNSIQEGYRPKYGSRGSGYYGTKQIGVSINLIWNWKFVQGYVHIGNSVLTAKKESKKGYYEWDGEIRIFPTSHNFDYRFPLTFETGIALSFDRIKNKEKKTE